MPRSTTALLAALLLSSTAGCSDDDHDHGAACDEGAPAFTNMTLTPDTVMPGATIEGAATVTGFELSGEEHAHNHDHSKSQGIEDRNPLDSDEPAECTGGHVHVYMDDLMTNPLTQAVTSSFSFQIPDDAMPGTHTIIGRLHNRDHTILKPEVTFEVDITVQ